MATEEEVMFGEKFVRSTFRVVEAPGGHLAIVICACRQEIGSVAFPFNLGELKGYVDAHGCTPDQWPDLPPEDGSE